MPNPPTSSYSLTDAVRKLLKSQREFIFAPDTYSVVEGGFRVGKSFATCLKGLILSIEIPNNFGIIGRLHGTDLTNFTIPTFFEVCPEQWIRSYNKERNLVTLRNGSQVLFRHMEDAAKKSGKKSRAVGANCGWFGIDQLEECTVDHWNTMVSRLSLQRAHRKFGFANANPNGPDWIFKHFFQDQYRPFKDGEFYQVCRSKRGLGIAVKSDENRVSNGGFIADEDFDNMRSQMPPEWIARYLDCSFEGFSGKIYRDYFMQSVHNIVPFSIPHDYPYCYSIDVGGSAPWAIGAYRMDPQHNLILVAELHKPNINSGEAAAWIKQHVNLSDPRTFGVIDYENRLAMLELNQLLRASIRPAMKAVIPGITQTMGYMYVNPHLPLPKWYFETQSNERLRRFEGHGSPQLFVFETCEAARKSWDGYVYDDNGKPKKENDHHADQLRYMITQLPRTHKRASILTPQEARVAKLRETSPASAREAVHIERHFRQRALQQSPMGALADLDADDYASEMVDGQRGRVYDDGDD